MKASALESSLIEVWLAHRENADHWLNQQNLVDAPSPRASVALLLEDKNEARALPSACPKSVAYLLLLLGSTDVCRKSHSRASLISASVRLWPV